MHSTIIKLTCGRLAAIAATVCAMTSPLAAEVAALSVAVSGNDVTISVPADVLDSTSKLYLVWDTIDHGTKLDDWPSEKRIEYAGTVSSAAASYVMDRSSIPARAYVRAIATTDVRLIDGYVKIAHYQYVNTGVKDTEAYGLEIRYRPTGTYSANYASLMGGVRDRFTIGRHYNDTTGKYYIRYGTMVSATLGTEVGNPAYTLPDTTNPHTVKIFDKKLYVDNEIVSPSKAPPAGTVGRADVDVILGTTWHTTNYASGGLDGSCVEAEWYHVKMLDESGDAIQHLVPAIRANGTAEVVFYDMVSGACIGNAGTGPLVRNGTDADDVTAATAAATISLFNGHIATWTGGGDPMDAADSDNWIVADMGTVVPNSIPQNGTKIAGSTLAADADWSSIAGTNTWVQQVEYVDVATGVYVDTGFCPNQDTRVVMDVTVQGGGAYEYWFGAWTNSHNKGAFAVGNTKNNVYSGFGDLGGGNGKPVGSGRHVIDFDKGVLKVDGTTHTTRSGQTFQLDKSIYLFMQNRNGSPYAESTLQKVIRFHSCQIYDNGVPVRNYVPVLVGGSVKLYDQENGALVEFQKKAGTETVVAGNLTGVRLAGDTVEIDGTIDLAGHRLTVGDLTGEGTITDSADGGELHVAVGVGVGLRNESVAITGGLKLVKEGAGLLIGAKSGQAYTGGTLISNGWIKRGVNDRPFGTQGALITVVDGAAFDWAGGWVNGATSTAYSFSIKGSGPDGNGAIVSSVSCGTWNVGAIADLELTGDALIGGYGGWGFCYVNNTAAQIHTVTMNGHTLNIKIRGTGTTQNNTGIFHFRNVQTVGSGTIAMVDCGKTSAWVYPSFFSYGSDLSSVTFDFGEGYSVSIGVDVAIGTFIDRRSYGSQALDQTPDIGSRTFTVLDCFRPMTTNLVRTVTLGDATHLAPVLDLSELDGPFVLPSATYSLGAANGATVRVDVGARKTSGRTPLVAWTTPPAGVSFAWPDGVSGKGSLVVKDDGLYVVKGLTIIVR